MGKIFVGSDTEFSRSSDKPFEWAVEKTAESTSNLAAGRNKRGRSEWPHVARL